MTIYLPSAQWAFTWSYIDRITVRTPPLWVVHLISADTFEFIDPTAPLQPGFITVPKRGRGWDSNHVTIDHVIERAWYVTDATVEHDWNDWEVKFLIDGLTDEKVIQLAVYSYLGLKDDYLIPPPPADYWRRPSL